MNKKLLWVVIAIVIVGLVCFILRSDSLDSENDLVGKDPSSTDYKNTTYIIDGMKIKLVNGVAQSPTIKDSSLTVTTQYFGNELKTDLNGDGLDDIAFIVTHSSGGTGTFYYAVAALNTPNGYVGSDGYLLGDRISPQSTHVSLDAKHKYVVVFNYADRAHGEPMTATPSIGKSVYLKLDPVTMQWGVVLSPGDRQSL